MVGLGFDVVDLVFLELRLKAAFPVPARVLPPIVREHLFGRIVLGGSLAVHLNDVLPRLAAEQLKPGYIAGIIVDVPDQVGVVAAKTERENVRLPKLVRS